MTQLSRVVVCCCTALILAICAGAAWGQAVPVYVSGGSNIYKVSGGSATTLTLSGVIGTPNFESLAIGPDNADTVGGNASHPALLYACDTANNNIYRFDPTAALPIAVQLVYNNASGIVPECGRTTSTGDFYVTNKGGAGVFQLIAGGGPLANISLFVGPIGATALQVPGSSTLTKGRGITQKHVGDILAVDNTDNKVFRAPFGSFGAFTFGTLTPFASSNLSSPVGISRISTGEVFVANSVLGNGRNAFPPVSHFNRDGSQPANACASGLNFSQNTNEIPAYLASEALASADMSSVTDTVYLVTSSNTKGTLWSWNTASRNCSLGQVVSIQNPLSGVAVAPAPVTLAMQVSSSIANPTPTVFNFNSSQFWLTANGCTANVTATPLVPATVNAMISVSNTNTTPGLQPFLNTATPAPDLGGGGYETVYVAHWLSPAVNPGCLSVFTDHSFETSIFGFYDNNLYTNPRVVQCDNGDPTLFTQSTEPQIEGAGNPPATTCGVTMNVGVYPIGGPLPGDGGLTNRNSFFATVNETAGQGNTTPGQFCGFQPPLTGDGTTLPNRPPSFSSGGANTVNVKFKLADLSQGGSCKNGPYVNTANALISVNRRADAAGPFRTINVQPTSSSLDTPPLFNSGNNQYSFTLNLPSVFAQGGAGTYIITVTFLTDNTTNQITSFQLTP